MSLITLFSFSSLKIFLISLSILFLISSFALYSLKRFAIPFIVVTIVFYFSFSNLKLFFTSLIMFVFFKDLDFPSIYVLKKINCFLKNKSLLLFKKPFKILVSNTKILWSICASNLCQSLFTNMQSNRISWKVAYFIIKIHTNFTGK